eukprot:456176_1
MISIDVDNTKQSSNPTTKYKENDLSIPIIINMIEKIMDCWTRRKLYIKPTSDITRLIVLYYNNIATLKWSQTYCNHDTQFMMTNDDRCIRYDDILNYDLRCSDLLGIDELYYALPKIEPINTGTVCWRIKVKNPNKGWILFGISKKEKLVNWSPIHAKSLYGIAYDGCYTHNAKNNQTNLNALTAFTNFEVDMLLDTMKQQLLICMIVMSDFYPVARIWDLPKYAWVPHIMLRNSAKNCELQIAQIENILYGIKCGDIYSTEKYINAGINNLPPVQLEMSERIFATIDRDNNVISDFKIEGNLDIKVNDINAVQCIVDTNINPKGVNKYGKIKWRKSRSSLVDSSGWKIAPNKKWLLEEPQSICKWRIKMNEKANECLPVKITYCHEMVENIIYVDVEIEFFRNIKNMVFIFPMGGEIFSTSQENGMWDVYCDEDNKHGEMKLILDEGKRDSDCWHFEWQILNAGNVTLRNLKWNLWPINVEFEMSDVDEMFGMTEIKRVADKDYKRDIDYHVVKRIYWDKYQIRY